MAGGLDVEGLMHRLEQQLQAGKSLDGHYVISGDEPLLVTEALDGLRALEIQAGYAKRTSLVMDARNEWAAVTRAMQNVSLFGDRRLVELKIPRGKPGKAGGATLAGPA